VREVSERRAVEQVRTSIRLPPACATADSCHKDMAHTPGMGAAAHETARDDACGVCGGDGSSCRGCTDAAARTDPRGPSLPSGAPRLEDGSCAYDCGGSGGATEAALALHWAGGEMAISGAPGVQGIQLTGEPVRC
jgi:hypothetical protein